MTRVPSYVFVVNGGEIDHHGIKVHPAFLEIQMSDKEALQLVEWIVGRLKFGYPVTQVLSGELTMKNRFE